MYCSIDFFKQFLMFILKGFLNLCIICIIMYKEMYYKEEYKQEIIIDILVSIVYFVFICIKMCVFFNILYLNYID